jgi:hypothetical protein
VIATGAGETALAAPDRFAGHAEAGAVRRFLLKNNGLKIELVVDPTTPSGGTTRRIWRMSASKARSRRSWTARIRSPRSMPPTRRWPTATGSA